MAEGFKVLAHTIAFVAGKAILRIAVVEFDHAAVAGDFGDDAGRGDAQTEPVAPDQRGVFHGEAVDGQAVHQGMLRPSGQGCERAGHGEVRGAQDVETVDFPDGRFGHGPEDGRGGGERGVKLFALGRADFFRIGQSVEMEAIGQHDRGRHDRTGQRSASGLIDTRHQKNPAGAQGAFAGKVTGHGEECWAGGW